MKQVKQILILLAIIGAGGGLLRFFGSMQDERRLRNYLRLNSSGELHHIRVDRSIIGEPSYYAVLSSAEAIEQLSASGFHIVQDSRSRDDIVARIRLAFPEETIRWELPFEALTILENSSMQESGWYGVAVVYGDEAYIVLNRS